MSNNDNKRIEEEVERCRQDLRRCPSSSLDRLRLVSDLSDALFNRYKKLGGIKYLEESITYYRQGIDLCPVWNPRRPFVVHNLGTAMLSSWDGWGIWSSR